MLAIDLCLDLHWGAAGGKSRDRWPRPTEELDWSSAWPSTMKLSQAHWKGKEGFREGVLKRLKKEEKEVRMRVLLVPGAPSSPSPLLTPLPQLSHVLSCSASGAFVLSLLSALRCKIFAAGSSDSGDCLHSQGASEQGQGKRAALTSLPHHSSPPGPSSLHILCRLWLPRKLTDHSLPLLLRQQELQTWAAEVIH